MWLQLALAAGALVRHERRGLQGLQGLQVSAGGDAQRGGSEVREAGATRPTGRRGLYVSIYSDQREPDASRILGDRAKEAKLLRFCADHGINALTLYDGYPTTRHHQAALGSFVQRARRSGIERVELAVSESAEFLRRVGAYQRQAAQDARFDGVATEIEYWHGGDKRVLLDAAEQLAELPARSGTLRTSAYLGWVPPEDVPAICQQLDEVWLHAYVPDPKLGPGYIRDRRERCGGEAAAVAIFSAEGSAYHDDQAFMGDWVAAHSDPLAAAERAFRANDRGSVAGFQWFAYHYLLFYTKEAHRP